MKDAIGTWQVPGSQRIEYSLTVLEELRRVAEDGFQRIGHGGIEVGGVLFGVHDQDCVRILDWRELEIQHARGPGFVFSSEDEESLAKLLEEARTDADLSKLEPVGWYHSHTRTRIFLSDQDLEIHSRHFGNPWQIALVLHPAKDEPMKGGFFFREADGGIHSELSKDEFDVFPNPAVPVRRRPSPGARRRPLRPERPESAAPGPRPDLPPRAPVSLQTAAPEPLPPPAWQVPPQRRFPWAIVLGLGLIAAIATAAAITRSVWLPVLQPPPASLGLAVTEIEGQLHLTWNRFSDAVQEGTRGRIHILDGKLERSIELDAAEVRRGSVTYARDSEDVQVRFVVERGAGGEVQEIARFLGATPPKKLEAQLEETRQQKNVVQEEADRLRRQLNRETVRTRQLQESIRALEDRAKGEQRKAP